MTVTTSAVPVVRLALFGAITDALPGVEVTYGATKDMAADGVIVGGLVNDGTQQVVLIGAQSHSEQFLLGVHITAGATGRDPQAAYERWFELLAAIEVVLRDNTALGISTFYVQSRVSQFGVEEIATDEGARVEGVLGVLVNAQLMGR